MERKSLYKSLYKEEFICFIQWVYNWKDVKYSGLEQIFWGLKCLCITITKSSEAGIQLLLMELKDYLNTQNGWKKNQILHMSIWFQTFKPSLCSEGQPQSNHKSWGKNVTEQLQTLSSLTLQQHLHLLELSLKESLQFQRSLELSLAWMCLNSFEKCSKLFAMYVLSQINDLELWICVNFVFRGHCAIRFCICLTFWCSISQWNESCMKFRTIY